MRSKTKYFIIALLFALIAFTGVGVSKWNIHIQQQFNDPFKAVDHVTADPIIGRYIRIQNAETEDVLPGADLTYNGNPYTVAVTNAGNSGETNASTWTEWQDAGLTFTYSYTGTTAGGSNYSSKNAPKDAGTYTCKITAVAGGSDASAKTAAKELNIYTASDGSNYAAEISFVVKQKEGAITGNITSGDKPSAANLSTFAQKVAPLAETTGTTRATDPLSIYFEPTISEADKLSALFVPQKDGNNLPYYDAKYNGATKQLTLDARFETGVVVAADVDTTGIEFEFKDADGKALTDLTNASNDKIYTATAKSTNPNYKVTNYEFRFKIVQRIITVKIATDHTSVYGDPIQDYNYTGSDLASGDDIKDIVSITVKNASGEVVTLSETSNAGTYTMQGAQRNDNQTAKNYSVTTITEGRYEITKRPLKVTIDNATSVYGDPIATLTCKGDNLVNSDDIYDIVSLSTTAKATSNVGSYNIEGVQLTSGVANNYEVTFANNGTYTITKRPITVKIDDKSSIYGNDIETLTCSTNPQDNVAINDELNNIVSLSTEASATAACGTYPITGTQLTNGVALNYTVTFENGTYAITKRTISLTYEKDTFTYTGNVQHPTVELNNKASHDTLEKVISVAYNGGTDVGSYKATITLTDTTNYQWAEGTATEIPFTITPADITATVSPYTGTYDNAEHPIATVNSTTVGGQTATIKYTLDGTEYNSAPNIKDAGSYTFTVTITAPNHNEWTGSYTATIQKIKLAKPTRGSNAQFTFNGEPITYYPDGFDSATMNITGNTQTNRGRHSTVTTLKDPDNYEWSDGTNGSVTIPFTIDYLTFNPTKTEKTFTYNGSNQYNDILTNGVKDGQNNDEYYSKYLNVAVEKGGTTVTDCIDAGDYTFVFTLKDSNNTTFFGSDTEVRLTFTISKATIDLNGFSPVWECFDGDSKVSFTGTPPTASHTGNELRVEISNLNTISLPTGITGVDVTTLITINYTGNTGNSEGDYTANATISPADANNYTVINMPAGGYTLDWKISTIITVTVPTFTMPAEGLVYNGGNRYDDIISAFNGTYDSTKMTLEITKGGTTVGNVDEKPNCTNAGDYVFKFTINTKQYVWDTESIPSGAVISADGTTASVTVNIAKATISFTPVWGCFENGTEVTFTDNTVTYTGNAFTVQLKGLDTEKLNVEYRNNVQTNANTDGGKYTSTATVSPIDTDNYQITGNASCTIEWTISKKSVTLTWTNVDNRTYDDTIKNPTATYTDVNGNTVNANVSFKKDNTAATEVKNAGNYTATASISDNNYVISGEAMKTFTINKLSVYLSSGVIEKSYGETATLSIADICGYFRDHSNTVNNATVANLVNSKFTITATVKNYTSDVTKNDDLGLFSYTIDNNSSATYNNTVTITKGSTYLVTISVTNNSPSNMSYDLNDTANGKLYYKYKTVKIDDVNSTTYYTIEDAISASGTNIFLESDSTSASSYVVTAFSNVGCYSSTTFNCNKNITVPYAKGTTASSTQQKAGATNVGSVLIIQKGISLNLTSKTLDIQAIVAFIGSETCTTRARGVVMNHGTITANGSTITAYGYLKGSGTIELTNNSTVNDLFHIYDFKGGGNTLGIVGAYFMFGAVDIPRHNYFPINAYSVHNVSCKTKVNAGSYYKAHYEFEMGGDWFTGDVTVVGKESDSSCLFKLSSGYIEKSAAPANSWATNPTAREQMNTITGSNQKMGQKEKINIYGSVVDGIIKITAKIKSIIDVEIQTNTEKLLPIPYMDIVIGNDNNGNKGSLTLQNSSYKFMPGSSITVEKGTTLKTESGVQVVFYSVEECTKLETTSYYQNTSRPEGKAPVVTPGTYPYAYMNKYCVDKIDAYLKVGGTATLKGRTSGTILADKDSTTASLTITNNTTDITVLDQFKAAETKLSVAGIIETSFYYAAVTTRQSSTVIAMRANGLIWMSASTPTTNSNFSTGTYKSDGAHWYKTGNYNITYDPKGGSVNTSGYAQSGEYGKVIGALPYPSRTGYTFNYWAYNGKEVTATDKFYFVEGNALTLTAVWTAIEYDVSFDTDHVGSNPTSIKVPYDGKYYEHGVTAPTVPTGYVFNGWYTAKDGGNIIDENTIFQSTQPVTLYAHWSVKVTIYNNVTDNETPREEITPRYAEVQTLVAPTHTGYVFDGWSLNKNGERLQDTYPLTSPTTLYARWEAVTNLVTITFNHNYGGSPTIETNELNAGSAITKEVSRPGYTFLGWFDAPEGGNKVTEVPDVATTLYAHWQANTYTVSFNTDGVGTAPPSITVTFDDTYGVTAPTVPTGYVFDGWYTAQTGGTLIEAATTVSTASNIMLYARWKVIVTLDANGGSSVDPLVIPRGSSLGDNYSKLDEIKPTREHYKFDGWTRTKDSDDYVVAAENDPITEPLTLYAHWTLKSYTIKFVSQEHLSHKSSITKNSGETISFSDTNIVNFDTASVDYNIEEKQQYFTGWKCTINGQTHTYGTNDTCTLPDISPYTEGETTITFTAVWANKATVQITMKSQYGHGLLSGYQTAECNFKYKKEDNSFGTEYCKYKYKVLGSSEGKEKWTFYLNPEQTFTIEPKNDSTINTPANNVTPVAGQTHSYTVTSKK